MKHIVMALMLFYVVVSSISATSGIDLYNQGRLYEAEETLEQAVEAGRAGIDEMAVLGMTYTRLGKYQQARQMLLEARQLAPDLPLVLQALAMLEMAVGNYAAAYQWLDLAKSGRESSDQSVQPLVASLINRAVQLYRQGQFEQAAAALEEARTLDPRNVKPIAMLIQLYRELNRIEPLIPLYKALIKIQPENAQAYAELGTLLNDSGVFAEAEKAFLQAEHYNTEEPYPYYFLARTSIESSGRADEQRSRLHLAIGKTVRKIAMLRVQAAGTLQQQQGELNAEELEALQELTGRTEAPKQILHASIALLKSSYTQPSNYEQDLRRLIEWYPHSLELRCELGHFLQEQHRLKDAREHWRALLSDFPTAVEAHIGLASSLHALGLREEARIAYLRARDLEPENPAIYRALQQLYTATGNEHELLQLYTDIYERERTNIALIHARAEIEEQLGLTEQASSHRLRAAELEHRREKEEQ